MTIKEYIKRKILKIKKLADTEIDREEELTFINDDERLTKAKIREYNVWYFGDGDELLNFYTRENAIEYQYEPFYSRNKKNYFWAISSTENDIKRTHSGQPRNIVDTLVGIMRFPLIKCNVIGADKSNICNQNLRKILQNGEVSNLYKQEQMPMTLVEGWGAYKIDWDSDFSEYPIPIYYRAENVDFLYYYNKITGVIFKDFYTDGHKKYMLTETRRLVKRDLVIEKELFEVLNHEDIKKVSFDSLKELEGTQEKIVISNLGMLFAVPCILMKNLNRAGGYGRSIFTGKIDLFDDLDQCLSQSSNSVRRSTPVEYFNSDYLDRDENTGMPIQPTAYDRKYIKYRGGTNVDGTSNNNSPVEVTQPQINFEQYNAEAQNILIQILNGIMSPATLGIDVAKKDNAEAQREKEKVTIFTRNGLIDSETIILKSLCNQLLCAYEFIKKGVVTCRDYDISVKFSEFADDSFENKLKELVNAFDSECISEELFIQKLYGDTLSEEEYDFELNWLKEHHTQPKDDGMQGADGGGINVEGESTSAKMAGLSGDPDELDFGGFND